MANKKNVQSMTPEELAAYVEVVRQRNAANATFRIVTKILVRYSPFCSK